ncbi:MAG: hypothetical protein ACI8S3_001947 [Alphaproteobacteria bacterium]|jgi:hypothetical protein
MCGQEYPHYAKPGRARGNAKSTKSDGGHLICPPSLKSGSALSHHRLYQDKTELSCWTDYSTDTVQ